MQNTNIYFNGSKFNFFTQTTNFKTYGVFSGEMAKLASKVLDCVDGDNFTLSIQNDEIFLQINKTPVASFNDFKFTFDEYECELVSFDVNFEDYVMDLLVETDRVASLIS